MTRWQLQLMATMVTLCVGCQSVRAPIQPTAGTQQQSNAPASASGPNAVGATAKLPALSINRAMQTGELQHPELSEVSGITASTLHNGVFWAINDSGHAPRLYAFNQLGESLGYWQVNAHNRDWEDLASVSINDNSYLLIADIGDNLQSKDEHLIHVVVEPTLDTQTKPVLNPVHTIRFRYPGTSHNAEALAATSEALFIMTKEPMQGSRRQRSLVFRLPLNLNAHAAPITATQVATMPLPARSIESSIIASLSGVDISQPTAFEIDQNNRFAYVLTYRGVFQFERKPQQSWGTVLSAARKAIHTHSLSQAEALTVDANGIVWFTSEKRPAPLWALPGRR